jgi:hypothetical protein
MQIHQQPAGHLACRPEITSQKVGISGFQRLGEIWEKLKNTYFTIEASTAIREAYSSGSCHLHRIHSHIHKKKEHRNFSQSIFMAKWSKYVKLGEIWENVQIENWSTEALLPILLEYIDINDMCMEKNAILFVLHQYFSSYNQDNGQCPTPNSQGFLIMIYLPGLIFNLIIKVEHH